MRTTVFLNDLDYSSDNNDPLYSDYAYSDE